MSALQAGEQGEVAPAEPWLEELAAAGVAPAHRAALARLLIARGERGLPVDLEGLGADYRHWVLFERGRGGDAAAAATFDDYWRARLRRCLAKSFDPPAIEELTSEFFARAFDGVARGFAWQCPFTAYLQAVLANIVRDAIARRAASRAREAPLSEGEHGSARLEQVTGANQEVDLLAAERRRLVARALATVPPLDRQALIATILDGESGQDVADRLGIKRQALYMRLHRAKLALRAELAAAGLSPGGVLLEGGPA